MEKGGGLRPPSFPIGFPVGGGRLDPQKPTISGPNSEKEKVKDLWELPWRVAKGAVSAATYRKPSSSPDHPLSNQTEDHRVGSRPQPLSSSGLRKLHRFRRPTKLVQLSEF